jgi:hypothetical protein
VSKEELGASVGAGQGSAAATGLGWEAVDQWMGQELAGKRKKGAVNQGHSQPAAARLSPDSPQIWLGCPLTGWRRKRGAGGDARKGQGRAGKGHRSEVCLVLVHTHSRIEDSRMMVNRSPRCDGGMISWGGDGDGDPGGTRGRHNPHRRRA